MSRASHNLAFTLVEDGRQDDAVSVGLEACRLSRRCGLVRGYGIHNHTGTAVALMTLGRWEEAERLLDELFELDPPMAGRVTALGARAAGRMWRGDLAGARADLAALSEVGTALHAEAAADLCRQLAELDIWEGRLSDARAAVSDGLKRADAIQPHILIELCVAGLCAEAALAEHARARHAVGEQEAAVTRGAELFRHVRGAAAAFGPTTTRWMAAVLAIAEAEWTRVTGLTDPSRWSDVADVWESAGVSYRAAYARWRQAEVMLASGRSRHQASPVVTSDRGPDQPPDRRTAVHQRQDGQRARIEHSQQARCREPRRSGSRRLPARSRELTPALWRVHPFH